MAWRHYEGRDKGTVAVLDADSLPILTTYEHGIVSTGRTRVFVRATLPSGTEFTGEDEHSVRSALLRLAFNLSAVNLTLKCSGLDPRWRESGLSENTGWGYFVFDPEVVHMMSPVPQTVGESHDLDREIMEAVSSMRIGW